MTSKFPCPICKEIVFVLGKQGKYTLVSCGHKYKFKTSKFKKKLEKEFVATAFGLERIK